MKIKKTWFHYSLWGIFFVILFVAVGVNANGLAGEQIGISYIMTVAGSYLLVIASVAIIIGVVKLIEKLYKKFPDKLPNFENASFPVALESALVVLVMLIAAAIRVVIVFSANNVIFGTDIYYKYAIGQLGQSAFQKMNNGAYLYTKIIHVMNLILGEKPYSAMCLQVILQLAIILLLYFFMRKFLGKWQAMITFLLLSFNPCSFVEVARVTPDTFLVLLTLAILFGLFSLCRASKEGELTAGIQFLLFILLGCAIGFLMYLDLIGIVVLILAVYMLFISKSDDAWEAIHKPLYQNLAVGITSLAVFLVLIMCVSLNQSGNGLAGLITYGKLFIPANGFELQILTPGYGYMQAAFFFVFAGLWFGVFLDKEEDDAYPFAFIIILMTIFRLLGFDTTEYSTFAIVFWGIMAGIGLHGIPAYKSKVLSEEELEAREREKERKRLEKEAKADRMANMKTISLEVPTAVTAGSVGRGRESSVGKKSGKKGYGIGRSSEAPVSQSDEQKPVVSQQSAQKPTTPSQTTPKSSIPKVTEQSTMEKPPMKSTSTEIPKPQVPPVQQSIKPREEQRKPVGAMNNGNSNANNSGIGYKVPQPVLKENTQQPIGTIQPKPLRNMPKKEENVIIKSDTSIIQSDLSISDKEREKMIQTPKEPMITEKTETVIIKSDTPVIVDAALPQKMDAKSAVNSGANAQITSEIRKSSSGYSGTVQEDESRKAMSYDNALHNNQPIQNVAQGSLIQPIGADEVTITTESDKVETAQSEKQITEAKPKEHMRTSEPVKSTEPRVAAPSRRTLKPEYQPGARKMIHNPLPTPRPHVAKNLDYDFEPRSSELKYDLNDLQGKDYYDI